MSRACLSHRKRRTTGLAALDTDTQFSVFTLHLRLAKIIDCYAGGLVRALHGRARTLSVPPDIRHRMQQWDKVRRSWTPRDLDPLTPGLPDSAREKYSGKNGATYKLGRAVPLRRLDDKEYDAVRALRGHKGPYLPVVLEACRENQLSYDTQTEPLQTVRLHTP